MPKIQAGKIASLLGGVLIGDPNIEISDISDIENAREGHLAFLLDKKLLPFLKTTRASLCVVPDQIETAPCAIIRVKSPAIAFIKTVEALMPDRIPRPKGIHNTAVIGKNVSLGKNAAVGAHAVIEDNAMIGDRTIIYPLVYIGNKTRLGSDCIIYPNVSIRDNITIGSRVVVHPGSVIGSDGFGYDNSTGKALKIPHIGDVVIEDDVEIGACTTVDRAKFSHTRIKKGTKVDNLVQVAHNVTIGENCLIAAQCGISGSCTIGNNVMMGGQVGLRDHASLGDRVMSAAKTGITKSFPADTIIAGTPAKPIMEFKKNLALLNGISRLYDRVKALEETVKAKNAK